MRCARCIGCGGARSTKSKSPKSICRCEDCPPALAGWSPARSATFTSIATKTLKRLSLWLSRPSIASSPDLVFLTGDYFSGPDTMHRYLGAFRRRAEKPAPAVGVSRDPRQSRPLVVRRQDHRGAQARGRRRPRQRQPPPVLRNEKARHRRHRRSVVAARRACARIQRRQAATIAPSSSRTIPTPHSTRVICGRA